MADIGGEEGPDALAAMIASDAAERSALRGYLRRRIGAGEELEDIEQDVYLRVLTAPPTRPIENKRGFLRRLASNLLIDVHRRKEARMADSHIPIEDHMPDQGLTNPERIVGSRRELALIDGALENVGAMARDAFVLVRVEGFSHKEAARQLGITPKAVSHHVERTLARIARELVEIA